MVLSEGFRASQGVFFLNIAVSLKANMCFILEALSIKTKYNRKDFKYKRGYHWLIRQDHL